MSCRGAITSRETAHGEAPARARYDDSMSVQLTRHRFTVDDYHAMAEAGALREDDRVELIEGGHDAGRSPAHGGGGHPQASPDPGMRRACHREGPGGNPARPPFRAAARPGGAQAPRRLLPHQAGDGRRRLAPHRGGRQLAAARPGGQAPALASLAFRALAVTWLACGGSPAMPSACRGGCGRSAGSSQPTHRSDPSLPRVRVSPVPRR
jgi:hypothetical protein